MNEKQQKKEAVGVFKLVQIYMSDRKAKVGMTINGVAQDIAEAGYGNVGLRDEIYIQLCKQVEIALSDRPAECSQSSGERQSPAGESEARLGAACHLSRLLSSVRHFPALPAGIHPEAQGPQHGLSRGGQVAHTCPGNTPSVQLSNV